MKILIISNIFPPGFIGGYELGALDIAKRLSARGHHIYILTSDYFLDDREELANLNVSRSLKCTAVTHERISQENLGHIYYDFHNIRTLGDTIRRIKPDVVIAFNLHGLGAVSIVQYLQNIRMPTILYFMDNIFAGVDISSHIHQKYEQIFGKLKFSDSTRLIAMSKNVSNEIGHSLNVALNDVTYIPAWVCFDPKENFSIQARQGGRTRFVFCSRVVPHKGIDLVVDASEKLVQQGLTQFSVDVYGLGQITPFLQQLKAKNLDCHITYKGYCSKEEMFKKFFTYDALLFPTWEREAFGFVVSEAAAAGCFPIMTTGIGASEWFLDGHDCLKIFRNVDSLASAMLEVMLYYDEELISARSLALKSARKNFSFEQWLTVIEKECLVVTNKSNGQHRNLVSVTRGAESAFLFLSSLFRESLA